MAKTGGTTMTVCWPLSPSKLQVTHRQWLHLMLQRLLSILPGSLVGLGMFRGGVGERGRGV